MINFKIVSMFIILLFFTSCGEVCENTTMIYEGTIWRKGQSYSLTIEGEEISAKHFCFDVSKELKILEEYCCLQDSCKVNGKILVATDSEDWWLKY